MRRASSFLSYLLIYVKKEDYYTQDGKPIYNFLELQRVYQKKISPTTL